LFGIMVISLVGRTILRGSRHMRFSSSSRKGGGGVVVVLIAGAGLAAIGWIGMFVARAIKASVSRQREFLADASAVQFTRQSEGIAGALKKIGGWAAESNIGAKDPEEVSHMLFGAGSSGLRRASLFATHPPLDERIQALDPSFQKGDYTHIDRQRRNVVVDSDIDADSQSSSFAAGVTTAIASGGTKVLADSIAETVGQPQNEHVEFARDLRRSIPEVLYNAAHSSDFAFLLAISLVLDHSGKVTEKQFSLVREQLGQQRAQLVQNYFDELLTVGAEYRLPLLEILFPALKLRPVQELAYLESLTTRLMNIDGEIELFEFCFYRVMMSNIDRAKNPTGTHRSKKSGRRDLQAATITLLRVLADYGHDTDAERQLAFRAGTETLGTWAHAAEFQSDRGDTAAVLGNSLDTLLGLNSKGQDSLLRAVSATAAHDGRLSVSEAELVRAVCATLNYPLPPILVHR
jgi:hypothetical protein